MTKNKLVPLKDAVDAFNLEDADLADLITARKSAGDSRPLDELAESLGLDKSDYQ